MRAPIRKLLRLAIARSPHHLHFERLDQIVDEHAAEFVLIDVEIHCAHKLALADDAGELPNDRAAGVVGDACKRAAATRTSCSFALVCTRLHPSHRRNSSDSLQLDVCRLWTTCGP